MAHSIIGLGCFIYKKYYKDVIKEILETHPDEEGSTFWSGNKLKPKIIDNSEILDLTFFSALLQVLDCNNEIDIASYINPPHLNTIVLVDKASIMYANILKYTVTGDHCEKEEIIYDKDNNTHNSLLHSLVNTRAICYNISPVDKLTIRLKSGKIIPALSTTTSIISAFVVLDIIKYLNNINKFTEININIANNTYNVYQACRPGPTYNNMVHPDYGIKVGAIPQDFDTWTRITTGMKEVKTIFQLKKLLRTKYKIIPDTLLCNDVIVYNSGVDRDIHMDEIFDFVYRNNPDKTCAKMKIVLDIVCFSETGMPVLTPPIVYSYN